MSGHALIEQLTGLVTLLLDYPQGLSILLGAVPPPDTAAIAEMFETTRPAPEDPGVRIVMGKGISEAEHRLLAEESFNLLIERVGGWAHISAVTCEWSEMHAVAWGMVVDHVRWVKTNNTRHSGSTLERIADKHGVSVKTLSRTVQEFPQRLAVVILNSPIERRESA